MPELSVKPLLHALRGRPAARPPVWLMRQAGRYLPEYRAVRAEAGSFLDLCYTPALATEVTLQPIRRFGLDAAILFSDILVVPDALGVPLRFVEGEGPRLEPLTEAAAIQALDPSTVAPRLAPVYETVAALAAALPAEVTLIGFSGAPWTLAAYMVEGGGSRDWLVARAFARRQPELFATLIDRLIESVVLHLRAQADAGAEVVQLFDSWAGVLPPSELRRWCIEPALRIVRALGDSHPDLPVICFARGVGIMLAELAGRVRPAGLGIDTAQPLARIAAAIPATGPCLQGNLDPVALLAGGAAMLRETDAILEAMAGRPFIFNLGHGVLPQTDPAEVARLVRHLKSPSG